MAHISKRPSGNWQVRWQDPDGRSRARTLPTKRAAQALLIDVEEAVGRGHRWEPRDAREVPLLGVIAEQYIRSCALRLRPRTLRRYAENLEVFLRFVVATRRAPHEASILTKPLLEDFYEWLLQPANGLHGRQRTTDTARKIVEVVQLMWAWAEDSDRWPDQIPRPRKYRMKRSKPKSVRAPTWEEMDSCIAASSGWQRKLLTVLRYTGLRVGEAMQLEWDDLDFRQGTLFIRAEISKNREEREVYVTPHLLAEVGGWGVREGYLIPSGRRTEKRYRQPRARDVARAWSRAGVSRRVWEGSPHHAFRRGFKSEMMRAGAPPDAVDYLQGHVPRGGRRRYIDMHRAFDWEEVVGVIPEFTSAMLAYTSQRTG